MVGKYFDIFAFVICACMNCDFEWGMLCIMMYDYLFVHLIYESINIKWGC